MPASGSRIITFALTVGFVASLAAQTVTVTGKITGKLEGRPVASANVVITHQTVLDNQVAITVKGFGSGLVYYVGAYLDDMAQEALMERFLRTLL